MPTIIDSLQISSDVLVPLLMLPFIATLVVLARHILGLKSFGMYIPIIATYALFTLGFKIGITLIIYLAVVGIITRLAISPLRIHYISRISLVICLSTIASIVFLYVIAALEFTKNHPINSVIPIILIIAFCETFVSTQIQKGMRTSIYLFMETFVIAVLGCLLLRWNFAVNFVLNYPYVLILIVFINILIGKWKGLRLYEMWRFRTIKKSVRKIS